MLGRMRRPFLLTLALLVGGVFVINERPAHAQAAPSATSTKMAQDLVEQGRALGQQGKWGEALERFERAAALSGKTSPQLAFYVGYAESRVGKLVAAAVDLRRAIDLATQSRNDQVAKAAQAELPEVEARTPTLTITVNGTATPVSLQVDGAPLGVVALGSPVPLDPGAHAVIVQFANGSVNKQVSLVERQHQPLAIDPPTGASAVPIPPPGDKPAASSSSTGLPPTPPPAEPSDGSTRKTISYALMGVGGAALVTGGVFYLLARSAISPVNQACMSSPCSLPLDSDIRSDYHDAQTKQTISIVLASAGGAIAATGIVLFATRPSSGASSTPPTSAMLSPWLGVGGGGASLIGRF
jgi:hypothetical protein